MATDDDTAREMDRLQVLCAEFLTSIGKPGLVVFAFHEHGQLKVVEAHGDLSAKLLILSLNIAQRNIIDQLQ